MISIIKSPNICSLTKNSMIFEVQSNQYFPTIKIYPRLVLSFTSDLTSGYYFQFYFINPEDLTTEIIRFRIVDSYENEGDIEKGSGAMTLLVFTNNMINQLLKIKKLTSYYEINYLSPGNIELKAKLPLEELYFTAIENNLDEGAFDFTWSIYNASNDPGERNGYQLKALIYYNNPNEGETNTNEFELITSVNIALDENSKGIIDVSEILNGKIEADFDEVPIPPYIQTAEPLWYYIAPNKRLYYVEFNEIYDEVENSSTSSVLSAFWGGISTDDEIINDSINHVLTANKFLTWNPSGKQINVGQLDFLHFSNGNQAKNWKLKLKVWTNLGETTYLLSDLINLKSFQTVGFYANIEKYIDNVDTVDSITLAPDEEVIKYEFQIFEYNLISGTWETTPADTFLYYYTNYCNKKYILYFNSFMLPESFSTQSNWEESINVSSELASRGLNYNSSHLRSKNFFFNSKHQNSIVLESSILKREEAKRLQSMLNSTYSFILEDNRWIPVLIDTKKTPIWSNSEFTTTLKIELLKANSNDRASFYDALPSIEVIKEDYNYIFQLHLNGFNFKESGVFSIYKENGTLWGNCPYDAPTLSFKTYAAPEDWITEALPEGKYTFKVIITDTNLIEHSLKGAFEVVYETVKFSVNGVGTKNITLGSYNIDYPEVYLKYNLDLNSPSFSNAQINPTELLAPNFTTSGAHEITLKAPSFVDFNYLKLDHTNVSDLKFDQMKNLQYLNINYTDLVGRVYLNTLQDLYSCYIANGSQITSIEIGYLPKLTYFYLKSLSISTADLEALILEFWTFRKSYSQPIALHFISMSTFSSEALDMINGTGLYVGDGLVDNNFTVTIA